jgi:hypothetical protein
MSYRHHEAADCAGQFDGHHTPGRIDTSSPSLDMRVTTSGRRYDDLSAANDSVMMAAELTTPGKPNNESI